MRVLRKERFFLVASITIIVILSCSIGIYLFEHDIKDSSIQSLWDGVWWAFVTISTVGYGDKIPLSNAGKIVGLGLMISGIGLLSLVTATIASVFVEQKIKEGKGLETIKERNHIVICGWNKYTEDVLEWLNTYGNEENPSIVLVNELPVDDIDALKLKHEKCNLRFIRGNHTYEDALTRANIKRAKFVILMADLSGPHSKDRADERTILSALTIKSLAPKTKIVAELLDGDNKPYLKRANVDEIIIIGEHVASLLASAVSHPGLPKVFSRILSIDDNNKLCRVEIPGQFVGKTFQELSEFFKEKRDSILIGLLKEKKSMKLEDMLSDDTSIIETFIKEKIRESKKELFYEQEQIKVIINPDDDEIIGTGDYAVVLSKLEPKRL
ncbi:MAG: NAD-binding protein [Deltaproteobacteria bacterium]|nr:NAD-binding protein [Deltaproteobacteria bacterium]